MTFYQEMLHMRSKFKAPDSVPTLKRSKDGGEPTKDQKLFLAEFMLKHPQFAKDLLSPELWRELLDGLMERGPDRSEAQWRRSYSGYTKTVLKQTMNGSMITCPIRLKLQEVLIIIGLISPEELREFRLKKCSQESDSSSDSCGEILDCDDYSNDSCISHENAQFDSVSYGDTTCSKFEGEVQGGLYEVNEAANYENEMNDFKENTVKDVTWELQQDFNSTKECLDEYKKKLGILDVTLKVYDDTFTKKDDNN